MTQRGRLLAGTGRGWLSLTKRYGLTVSLLFMPVNTVPTLCDGFFYHSAIGIPCFYDHARREENGY